jgi:hypothetical protein
MLAGMVALLMERCEAYVIIGLSLYMVALLIFVAFAGKEKKMDDLVILQESYGWIVEKETGVEYASQVGGVMCEQKSAEGYFVPVVPDIYLKKLLSEILDYPTAEQLDKLDAAMGTVASLDREQNNMEAWIHFIMFDGKKAILTWPNSD